MNRKILTASEGMVLTNGEISGRTIYLGDGVDEKSFYEISQEDYDKQFVVEETVEGVEQINEDAKEGEVVE